jgi:hypothetical protein
MLRLFFFPPSARTACRSRIKKKKKNVCEVVSVALFAAGMFAAGIEEKSSFLWAVP